MSKMSFGLGKMDAVIAFEKTLAWKLPAEYREFLLNANGGGIASNNRYVDALSAIVIVDVLFGLGVKCDFEINDWHKLLQDELPKDMIIIGGDPYGNLFVLSLLDRVYFWDKMRKFSDSSDASNVYLVCEGFGEFLNYNRQFPVRQAAAIRGPLGSKLPESIWHDAGHGNFQEINRKVYVEFSRHEGFGLTPALIKKSTHRPTS